MSNLIAWIIRAVPFGTIIMYGAMGEILTEKSGNLNLGVPGLPRRNKTYSPSVCPVSCIWAALRALPVRFTMKTMQRLPMPLSVYCCPLCAAWRPPCWEG